MNYKFKRIIFFNVPLVVSMFIQLLLAIKSHTTFNIVSASLSFLIYNLFIVYLYIDYRITSIKNLLFKIDLIECLGPIHKMEKSIKKRIYHDVWSLKIVCPSIIYTEEEYKKYVKFNSIYCEEISLFSS